MLERLTKLIWKGFRNDIGEEEAMRCGLLLDSCCF